MFSLLVLSGCGSNNVPGDNSVPASDAGPFEAAQSSEADSPVLLALAATPPAVPAPVQEENVSDTADETEQKIDVDLSDCNRGITYAQMLQVCRSPQDYEGKLFRVKGKFNYSETNNLARIIFSDNTGCCEIALSFQTAQSLTYPGDYPPLWGDVMITARLALDQADPDMPCRFIDAVINTSNKNTLTPAVSPKPLAVDLDLSEMSGTIVYSQVYNMMYEPEQYIGKTVKMQGAFSTQEFNNIRYFACIVQDATACCAQGLEFQLKDSYVYPDDYPEPGTEITVVGTFDTYLEENDGKSYFYIYLRDAVLESQDSGQKGQQTGS